MSFTYLPVALLASCNRHAGFITNLGGFITWKVSGISITAEFGAKKLAIREVKAPQACKFAAPNPRYRPMLANLQSNIATNEAWTLTQLMKSDSRNWGALQ